MSEPAPPDTSKKSQAGLYGGLAVLFIVVATGVVLLVLWATGVIFKSKKDTSTLTNTQTASSVTSSIQTTRSAGVAPHAMSWPSASVWTGDLTTEMQTEAPRVQGNGPFRFAVTPPLPAGLAINDDTGEIRGTPQEPVARTEYTITASNAHGSAALRASLMVPDHLPDVGYPRIVQGVRELQLGRKYQFEPAPAISGEPMPLRCTWSVSPAFPPALGLTLDPRSGIISGVVGAEPCPSQSYTVRVRNGTGEEQPIVLKLSSSATPVRASDAVYQYPVATYDVGEQIPTNLLQFNGNADAVSIKTGRLPDGLRLDLTSGDIVGTPTTVGDSRVEIALQFEGKEACTATVEIKVAETAPEFEVPVNWPRVMEVGAPLEPLRPFVHAGNNLVWSVRNGVLPQGLALNPTTGEITGTVADSQSEGDVLFDLVATNSAGSNVQPVYLTILDSRCWTLTTSNYPPTLIPAITDAIVNASENGAALELKRIDADEKLRGAQPAELASFLDPAEAQSALAGLRQATAHLPGLVHALKVSYDAPNFRYDDLVCSTATGAKGRPRYEHVNDARAREYEFSASGGSAPDGVHIDEDTGEIIVMPGARPFRGELLVAGWNLGGRSEVPVKIDIQ